MTGKEFTLSCPSPAGERDSIQMAHGGGGRVMRRLLETVFLPAFGNPALDARHDSAVLAIEGARVAFTTDGYVVSPLFFPGGDIGRLAVYGTVNDLAMAGARPLALSAAFILEEGLPMETLSRIVASMREAAALAGVSLVTGDTKVVDRGKGDGVFITTAGVGLVPVGVDVRPARVRGGEAIVLSGDVGRHGIAILSVREGLRFEGALESDCAPLAGAVEALIGAGIELRCLRDLTRGGLASALNEIASDAALSIVVEETAIPVAGPVAGACEILGLDPLYVANEGRFIAFVPAEQAAKAAETLARLPVSAGACVIGHTAAGVPGVTLKGRLGGSRPLDLLSGEQLPRIC